MACSHTKPRVFRSTHWRRQRASRDKMEISVFTQVLYLLYLISMVCSFWLPLGCILRVDIYPAATIVSSCRGLTWYLTVYMIWCTDKIVKTTTPQSPKSLEDIKTWIAIRWPARKMSDGKAKQGRYCQKKILPNYIHHSSTFRLFSFGIHTHTNWKSCAIICM